jgi:aminopeptidase N
MAVRRAELGDYDEDVVRRLLESDPDPDAGMRRLAVLAARPDVRAKEEVWRAFFVDYAVPASGRPSCSVRRSAPRPGRAPGAVRRTATSRSCTRSRAGSSTRGDIRAM